jgi:glucosyl-3-phosphoglycerate synthase
MTEFHQEGNITTIHGFYDIFDREVYLKQLEEKLLEFSKHLHIGLLLPSLYGEIHVPGVLENIINQINQVDYLRSIVVALGGTKKKREFKEARDYFYLLKKAKRDIKVIWVDGPRIQKIFSTLLNRKINVGVPGKGQSVWISMGYLFAKEECDVIAQQRFRIL